MDTDFPAAHSMDTVWYAVDCDGNVACFFSGEAGAVPREACQGLGEFEDVLSTLPRQSTQIDLEGHEGYGEGQHVIISHHLDGAHYTLMRLATADALREFAGLTGVPITVVQGPAVYFRNLPRATFDAIHAAGLCLGCAHHYGGVPGEDERATEGSLGFYDYSHLCENWASGPYGRQGIPSRPLHIDQLPPAVRDAVGCVRFDFSFAETPHIQPTEHFDCDSWESQFVTVEEWRRRQAGEQELGEME